MTVAREINAEFFARLQASGEEEVILSDFCKVFIRGKQFPTVIAFSSVNTKAGRRARQRDENTRQTGDHFDG